MEVIVSEKNKTVILKDDYKFRFHKMLNFGVQKWTCCESTCFFLIPLKTVIILRFLMFTITINPKNKTLTGKKYVIISRESISAVVETYFQIIKNL